MLPVTLLFAVIYVLTLGVGMHVARHFAIYLIVAMATVLPAVIFAQFYSSSGSPIWILFTDLLGDRQSQYATAHATALLLGFLHGVVLQFRRRGSER
jgi:hypothetical protein